jgi:hypothetical protein
MVGPPYPAGLKVPEVRMYTGYGMNGTIVKPPYSTLTAYDSNTGTLKWQVPAGGDDPRAVAEGATNAGYISAAPGSSRRRPGCCSTRAATANCASTTRKPASAVGHATASRIARHPCDVRSEWPSALRRERYLTNRRVDEQRFASARLRRVRCASRRHRRTSSRRDVTGSTLAGWRTLGDAKWRAENGEIVATPGAGGC